jgi:hypothetical protein
MTEAIRRNLIESDLHLAVQQGKLTQRERFLTLWHLKVGDWTLNHGYTPTALKARAVAASPLLATNATHHKGAATDGST